MGAPALAPRRAPSRAPARRKPARRSPAKRSGPARRTTNAKRASGRSTARRRQARGAGARRARAQVAPRPNPALAGAALIPHAAFRTAGAVRDISDSSLIVRLTSGRGWIAVLCALLVGIVALNVISLSISTTSGRVSQAIEEYERRNSVLRAELAESLSARRVEDAAVTLGLAVPGPEQVNYLESGESDLERLANALGGDTPLSIGSGSGSPVSGSYESSTYAPGTSSPASASAPAPSATPAPTAPAPTAPAPTAPAPAPSGGGGSSGGGSSGGVGL